MAKPRTLVYVRLGGISNSHLGFVEATNVKPATPFEPGTCSCGDKEVFAKAGDIVFADCSIPGWPMAIPDGFEIAPYGCRDFRGPFFKLLDIGDTVRKIEVLKKKGFREDVPHRTYQSFWKEPFRVILRPNGKFESEKLHVDPIEDMAW